MEELRITESTLLLPALYYVETEPGIRTAALISRLTDFFHPAGKDGEILTNRSDTYFSQKVRNLRSHYASNRFGKYTTFDGQGYWITALGSHLLHEEENWKTVQFLLENPTSYGEILAILQTGQRVRTAAPKKRLFYGENELILEGLPVEKRQLVKQRSQRLREAAREYYKDEAGKLHCTACGFCFDDRYPGLGEGYIELHHEKPLYQYEEEDFEKFLPSAIQNLKPLCANCHRMIHRKKEPLTVAELAAILKP